MCRSALHRGSVCLYVVNCMRAYWRGIWKSVQMTHRRVQMWEILCPYEYTWPWNKPRSFQNKVQDKVPESISQFKRFRGTRLNLFIIVFKWNEYGPKAIHWNCIICNVCTACVCDCSPLVFALACCYWHILSIFVTPILIPSTVTCTRLINCHSIRYFCISVGKLP